MSPRIKGIDSLRGLMIWLMVAAHLCYDLTLIGVFPANVYHSAPVQALIASGAGVFILISGAMARFSRSNLRRGVKYLASGLLITAVTLVFPQNGVIWFGILHLLGVSALLYAAFGRFFDRLTLPACAAGFLISGALTSLPVTIPGAWLLGFTHSAPATPDFFPVLPWVFVYLAGTIWGERLQAGAVPDRLARWDAAFLRFGSRHALPIYLLHQPVFLGILWIFERTW